MALPWYCTCEQAARATASEVAGVLETDPDRGLDPAKEVERRRKVHGLNQARSLTVTLKCKRLGHCHS